MFEFILRMLLLTVLMIAINIHLIVDNAYYHYIADITSIAIAITIFTECIYSKYHLA